MTTRQTVIGVQGPEHAITYDEAVALHTTQAARLLGEDHLRGTLTPGRLADSPSGTRTPLAARARPCATSTPPTPSSAAAWSTAPNPSTDPAGPAAVARAGRAPTRPAPTPSVLLSRCLWAPSG
jgi:hypothetical protein